MISTDGSIHIKRYMAKLVPSIAECIAFGIGDRAESINDTGLQFEIGRSAVAVTSFDFAADKVIFKATIPASFEGTIYEVAIFSQVENSAAGKLGSKLLTSFDSATETWRDSTSGALAPFGPTNTRLGVDSLTHTPAASGSSASSLYDLYLDLSDNPSADKMSFAYYVGNANTASLEFRFKVDNANYYAYTITTPTAGYRIDTFVLGSATVVGTPNWNNIKTIEVVTTANGSGAAAVNFDGILIENSNIQNPDYVMVAREVLAVPYTKENAGAQEIEFALGVTA